MKTLLPYSIQTKHLLRASFFVLVLILSFTWWNKAFNAPQKQYENFQSALHQKEITIEQYIAELGEKSSKISYRELFKLYDNSYQTLYNDKGMVLLIYENDSLKFWTDNHIPVENFLLKICLDSHIVKLNNGLFEVRRKEINNKVIIGLILIKNEYAITNNYLKDDFAPGFDIMPESTISTDENVTNYKVLSKEKNFLFSFNNLMPSESQFQQNILVILVLISFILLIFLLEKLCFRYLHQKGFYAYYLVYGLLLIAVRWLMIHYDFPSIAYHSNLFSPSLYAHTAYLPSLGDLLLHAVLIAVYVFGLYMHNKNVLQPHKYPLISTLFYLLLVAFMILFNITVLTSLVNDSKITINVNNLISLNGHSYVVYIASGLSLAALYFSFESLIKTFIRNNSSYLKVIISFALLALIILLLPTSFEKFYLILPLLWLVIQYLVAIQKPHQQYTRRAIVFIGMASLLSTFIIKREITKNDEEKIKTLADNLAIERDPVAEYLSTDLEKKIPADTTLINALIFDAVDGNEFINRLKQKYFNGYWEKFDIRFYAYDSLCNLMSKSPGAVFDKYTFFEDLFKENQLPSKNLCYIPPDKSAKSGFLLKYDLYKKYEDRTKFIAHIFVEADSKYLSDEIGFPMLLLDDRVDNQDEYSNLSYAIYRDSTLTKHHGKYIYNIELSSYHLENNALTNDFFERNEYKHYFQKSKAGSTYLVSIKLENWFNALTFFSYLFSIYSILFIVLVSITNPERIVRLKTYSLRNRIQALPIIMVLVALILFGGGTVYYLINQYKQKNAENLTGRMQSILREVEYKLGDEKTISFNSSDYLNYILAKFSIVFLADINLYDANGNLISLSRPKIIEEGLISEKMNPEAYLQMVINKQAQFINQEQIGKLSYLSAYIPFLNRDNKLLGYLNIPYFAKQTELQNEISTLLVALINIYVFLIVISLLVTLFIANKITDPLQMLQQKLANISLGKKNEPIDWTNNDEIGSLIIEYNRMIVELGESAERLAKSERESAWREMAKQVAHEIKNPLTPLRLNAQLIERAYDEKSPLFDEKFKKFTRMLIEQVDTLSQIANEFSNYAVMPKPKLAPIRLSEIVQNAVTLFRTTTPIEITFQHDSDNDQLLGDKEQLLRVFNNLIKNAIQAIADENQGKINIHLHKEKANLIVSIADNGKGISDEEKKLIFVPNFTTKSGGMGLGLSMVKSIVESMHGTINFESTENVGTTFTIIFNTNQS